MAFVSLRVTDFLISYANHLQLVKKCHNFSFPIKVTPHSRRFLRFSDLVCLCVGVGSVRHKIIWIFLSNQNIPTGLVFLER